MITVIVTAYNQEAFVGEAIRSVVLQTVNCWECLVIDDGSSDGTLETAIAALAEDPRGRILSKVNGGPSSARNFGLMHAQPGSRYLVFLDGDDLLAPSFLERLSGLLDERPDSGMITCGFTEIGLDGGRLRRGGRSRWVPGALGWPRQLRENELETPFVSFFCATGQGPFTMYRRSVFEKTNGWDESFWPHEDTDMACQMALLAPVLFCPDELYLKRVHAGSIMRTERHHAQMSFNAFRFNAYGMFREKWTYLLGATQQQSQVLKAARMYYSRRHKPCRDLKVAANALRDWVKRPKFETLRWVIQLMHTSFNGFIGRY